MTSAAVAREIAPDVYCLGPRGRTQTNVYFVRCDSSWALIDAGWAKDAAAITTAAASLFGADARPASILLTHAHPDELPLASGDLAAMTAAAGPLDTWIVLPLLHAMGRRREAMLARSSFSDVARAFEPGAGVPGLAGWECVPTPGHTPGHSSFLRTSDRVLITGDAVVTLRLNSLSGLLLQRQGLSGPPWFTTWSWRTAKQSVATLARLDPRVLAGGHGTPMTGADTAGALRAFADHLTARATAARRLRPR